VKKLQAGDCIPLITALLVWFRPVEKCVAQQATDMMSRAEAAESAAQAGVPQRYNIAVGSGGIYFALGLKGVYVDNVYLVHDHRQDDFILAPQLNLGAFIPIGQLNSLSADVGVAYYHYFKNDNLNTGTPTINPNSDLKFQIYSGDFRFTLSEAFSYEENPFYETGAQFFNIYQTGRFARFLNRAGVAVRWDLHQLFFDAGYHHEDLFSNGSAFEYINRHSELFNFAAELNVAPAVSLGLESAGSLNRFDHKPESDHWRAGIGPALKLKLTDYLDAKLGAGYQRIQYNSSEASALGLEGFNTFYAYGELIHVLNEFFNHSLRVSHDNEIGINAANLEGTHAIYTLNWNATEALQLSPLLGAHHFKESYGPGVTSLYHESFDYLAAGLNVGYALGRNWRVNARYDYRLKDSGVESLGYSQNRVSLLLTYQF